MKSELKAQFFISICFIQQSFGCRSDNHGDTIPASIDDPASIDNPASIDDPVSIGDMYHRTSRIFLLVLSVLALHGRCPQGIQGSFA